MSLVPKTRVSWGLATVVQGARRSLHLLKQDYRGNIRYYSKSARSTMVKVGFGQVIDS